MAPSISAGFNSKVANSKVVNPKVAKPKVVKPNVVNPKVANRIVAQVIPIILAAIVGYVTWVMVVLISVDYFLRPSDSQRKPRHRTGVGVLTVYSILLLLMSASYLRLVCTIIINPGYVPRGPQWHYEHDKRVAAKSPDKKRENSVNFGGDNTADDGDLRGYAYGNEYPVPRSTTTRPLAADEASPELYDFYGKEVFTCEGNGKPIWCSYCSNWKPDRAHHCREIGRVGGVVSETSFKFFIQFNAWAAVFCIFTLIVTAIVISERKKEAATLNVNYIVTISLAALFGLFTVGMSGSSLQFLILNTTTIENLSRHSKVWQLAIHIASPPCSSSAIKFSTISFPLAGAPPGQQPANPPKTFAILHSIPGENPWDLGPMENVKSVMGEHIYDWFLPLKHSPCTNHDRSDSQFALGPVVERMRIEAGLATPGQVACPATPPYRRRHRRTRRGHGESRRARRRRSLSQGGDHGGWQVGREIQQSSRHGVENDPGIALGEYTNGMVR
ncbi:palmitoyltransferase pfa5 [Pseudocyphellaria aurata]|nr:palmitoyltransferase pfa5 [Pseudocyphellaria aurata]